MRSVTESLTVKSVGFGKISVFYSELCQGVRFSYSKILLYLIRYITFGCLPCEICPGILLLAIVGMAHGFAVHTMSV